MKFQAATDQTKQRFRNNRGWQDIFNCKKVSDTLDLA